MKIIDLILNYLSYFFTSKGKHSIQGPFIFEFVTKVLYAKTTNKECAEIEDLRNKLSKSHKKISIIDFGAGSVVNPSKNRKIKDIAKNSSKNSKFGGLFYRIVKFYKPKNILELGTSLAISTSYLAKGNTEGKVYTFEGCPSTLEIAKHNLKELNIKNVECILGEFEKNLNNTLQKIKELDLVFIDGNHQEIPTIEYFKTCLKYSNNNTIFIFDDIYWSDGMQRAWKYIKEHHKTKVTLDLFFVGIVFLKSELSNEHFKIRF